MKPTNEKFDESLLSAYLDDELEPDLRTLVEEELAKSAELRVLLAELSTIRSMVSSCNIPLGVESTAITGPWDMNPSTTLAEKEGTANGYWVGSFPRLASLAAAIVLLLGIGAMTVAPKWLSQRLSFLSEGVDTANRKTTSMPAPTSTRTSVETLQRSSKESNADRSAKDLGSTIINPPNALKKAGLTDPSRIESTEQRSRSEAFDKPANGSPVKGEDSTQSLVVRFLQFINSDTNKENLSSSVADRTVVLGRFQFDADEPLLTDKSHVFIFSGAKGNAANTQVPAAAPSLPTDGFIRLGDDPEMTDQESAGSQKKIFESTVELLIPLEHWDAASTLLKKKGFSLESLSKDSEDFSRAEALRFRASVNRSFPTEWKISIVNQSQRASESSSKVGDDSKEKAAPDGEQKSSNEKRDQGTTKKSVPQFRRIQVSLSEDSSKSSSNE